MKCQVCKTNEATKNSIVCSDNCNDIRLTINILSNKYTPTNGCDNCWGDLHQGCTLGCKKEKEESRTMVEELYGLVRTVFKHEVL